MYRYLIAGLVGVLLGVIAARYLLVGSALSLIPWAIAGLVMGWSSRGYAHAAGTGAFYGFVLSYAFLIASYNGSTLAAKLLPMALLSLVGLCCGVILAVIGYFARQRILKSKEETV